MDRKRRRAGHDFQEEAKSRRGVWSDGTPWTYRDSEEDQLLRKQDWFPEVAAPVDLDMILDAELQQHGVEIDFAGMLENAQDDELFANFELPGELNFT
jgi:hypothetical protein